MNNISVEIILYPSDHINKSDIVSLAKSYLSNNQVKCNTHITEFDKELYPGLHDTVRSIIVHILNENDNEPSNFESADIKWFLYTLNSHGPMEEMDDNDDENGQVCSIASHLVLPAEELYNSWENLYYDNNIKQDLLSYAETMMYFSDQSVDQVVINCNRVILLHGPPGTGKTSLCKALAQKLAIRMQERFPNGMLIEINSHSLFSKWFSESGKLVTKLFSKIKEILENQKIFVCVLMDEVESLAHARNQCFQGNEPSDSLRVVNALLTEIDHIKRYPNLLIMTTSNITESIDIAFVDRADIKQYLGLPTAAAIYKIYSTCISELIKRGVVNYSGKANDFTSTSLNEICEKSSGLSGRALRKVPFIAHALFVRKNSCVDLDEFLAAMEKAIVREKSERTHLKELN